LAKDKIVWPVYPSGNNAKSERNLAIYKARVAGRTYTDIGAEFNKSPARMRSIYEWGVRLLKAQQRWHKINTAWARKYRHKIVQLVTAADPEVLREVAEVIDFEGKDDWGI
jgi:hypothetical protein